MMKRVRYYLHIEGEIVVGQDEPRKGGGHSLSVDSEQVPPAGDTLDRVGDTLDHVGAADERRGACVCGVIRELGAHVLTRLGRWFVVPEVFGESGEEGRGDVSLFDVSSLFTGWRWERGIYVAILAYEVAKAIASWLVQGPW